MPKGPDERGWTLDSLRADTLAWLEAHEWLGGRCTVQQVDKWRFHEFAALLYPEASVAIASSAGFWSQLIAVLDDVCEDDRSTIGTLRRLARKDAGVERGMLPTLARAWRDLAARIAGSNADFDGYLGVAFDDLLDSYEWEHGWRDRGGFPPLAEYETWRWRSGGVRIFGAILARQAGIAAALLERPAFDEAVQAAGTLACMANDSASARWDEAQHNPINAVCIANARGQSFEGWRARWQDRYAGAVASPELAEVPIFRRGLSHLVEGTARWMQLTGRYELASVPKPA